MTPDELKAIIEDLTKQLAELKASAISRKDFDDLTTLLYNHKHKGYDATKTLDTSSGSVAGSDTQIQFNDAGTLAGASMLTYDDSSGHPVVNIGTGIEDDAVIHSSNLATLYLSSDGDVNITGANSTLADGKITLTASSPSSGNVTGAEISVTAGTGHGSGGGGQVTIVSGDAGTTGGTAGEIVIVAGSAPANGGGAILLQGGAGDGGGSGGGISIGAGSALGGDANGGSVNIGAGDKSGTGVIGQVKLSNADGNFIWTGLATFAYTSPVSLDGSINNIRKTTTIDAVGNITIDGGPMGIAGKSLVIIIVNDATSGKVITFGTNFLSKGTLTGTISKTAVISFISDGTSWYEQYRTLGL